MIWDFSSAIYVCDDRTSIADVFYFLDMIFGTMKIQEHTVFNFFNVSVTVFHFCFVPFISSRNFIPVSLGFLPPPPS